MQFSTIKKRVMPFFTEALQGRIDLHSAVYRKAHDGETVVWFTLDGHQLFHFADLPFQNKQTQLYNEAKSTLPARPAHFTIKIFQSEWYKASHSLWERVEEKLQQEGHFDSYAVLNGLIEYPNISIEAARQHESLFIRGIALLDRRFGKRQLASVNESELSAFEKYCYHLRLEAEVGSQNEKRRI